MKQHSAELLMDAIGQIDDRWIVEAADLPPKPHKTFLRLRPRYAVLAAALLLVLAFPILSLSIALQGAKSANPGAELSPPQDNCEEAGDAGLGYVDEYVYDSYSGASSSLSTKLTAMRARVTSLSIGTDPLSLADGTPKVIWQYEEDQALYAVELTEEELNRLNSLPTDLPASVQENGIRLWISDGKGTVTTPYSDQAGTDLFAYEPTREPSAAWTEALLELIQRALP